LPQLVLAPGALGVCSASCERREQQGGQYPDDADDHKQLHQRESLLSAAVSFHTG
jgi:hypothetical protein